MKSYYLLKYFFHPLHSLRSFSGCPHIYHLAYLEEKIGVFHSKFKRIPPKNFKKFRFKSKTKLDINL